MDFILTQCGSEPLFGLAVLGEILQVVRELWLTLGTPFFSVTPSATRAVKDEQGIKEPALSAGGRERFGGKVGREGGVTLKANERLFHACNPVST